MDLDWYTASDDRRLMIQTTETPTFRKDWSQAVAAGFDRINDGGAYGTPTDEFLKGMAKDFQQQKRAWEYELQELGVLEAVYDDSLSTWVYVTPDKAAAIHESNAKNDEYRTKRAAAAKVVVKVKRDKKWYRKLLRIGRKCNS